MTDKYKEGDYTLDTIPKLMLYHTRERGNSPANRQKEFGIWKSWTWNEIADEIQSLACGLASLGFQRGDKLAETETDKTVVEMECYNDGILRKIIVRFQTTFFAQLFAIESEHATNNKNVRSNNMLILEITF